MKHKHVRYGVFETNSSSSHSITLAVDNSNVKKFITNRIDKTINVESQEFGWGYDEYKDFYNKVNYLYTYIINYAEERDLLLDSLRQILLENTDAETIVFEHEYDNKKNEGKLYEYGYIDHQSLDVARDIIYDKEKIIRFLFDKNSVLTISNDNS